MRSRRASRAAALARILSVASLLAVAPLAATPSPGAPLADDVIPIAGQVLADPDFGVSTREFGLDRQVQMYQWRRSGDRLERVWSAGRIESPGAAPEHQNPPLPLDSQRWWARDATLGGHPIDEEVLQGLGEWRPFRPGFTALPLNMAATFQPEGDGLGSAENPLAPEVGDLRITWRELHLPPLQGRIELRDGAWRLSARTAEETLDATPPVPPAGVPVADAPPEVAAAVPQQDRWPGWWWIAAGAMLAASGAVVAVVRRRR